MSRGLDHQLTSSPVTGISSGQPSSPMTPSPSLRNRNVDHSPDRTSSTFSAGSGSVNHSRANDIPRSTFRSIFASSASTPARHIVARSDPALLSCFDPLDKELYELWSPRK